MAVRMFASEQMARYIYKALETKATTLQTPAHFLTTNLRKNVRNSTQMSNFISRAELHKSTFRPSTELGCTGRGHAKQKTQVCVLRSKVEICDFP